MLVTCTIFPIRGPANVLYVAKQMLRTGGSPRSWFEPRGSEKAVRARPREDLVELRPRVARGVGAHHTNASGAPRANHRQACARIRHALPLHMMALFSWHRMMPPPNTMLVCLPGTHNDPSDDFAFDILASWTF